MESTLLWFADAAFTLWCPVVLRAGFFVKHSFKAYLISVCMSIFNVCGGTKYVSGACGGQKKKVLDVLSYELSVMSGQSHSMGCRVELMSAARATSVCSHWDISLAISIAKALLLQHLKKDTWLVGYLPFPVFFSHSLLVFPGITT